MLNYKFLCRKWSFLCMRSRWSTTSPKWFTKSSKSCSLAWWCSHLCLPETEEIGGAGVIWNGYGHCLVQYKSWWFCLWLSWTRLSMFWCSSKNWTIWSTSIWSQILRKKDCSLLLSLMSIRLLSLKMNEECQSMHKIAWGSVETTWRFISLYCWVHLVCLC